MENKELLIQYDQEVNRLRSIIKELEEENKKLKEENEIVHKDFNELSEKYFFEKPRIDKAIEHLKKSTYYNVPTKEYFDLLKILKGEENE